MESHIHRRMRRLRWTSYTLVALCYMLAYFHRMAPAAIATDLQQSFHASGAALGALAAAYFYTYTVMQLSLIHISEPTRLGMISYAVFCLKKKKKKKHKKP